MDSRLAFPVFKYITRSSRRLAKIKNMANKKTIITNQWETNVAETAAPATTRSKNPIDTKNISKMGVFFKPKE